ncbi:MAG: prephenate dehydrogenase [Propionibacteriaceae bacterium]|nr:prephenate dehydrogenase [Propionibacteriaceae bacterium]
MIDVGACESVLIVGTGLIGTSIGLALRERGYQVFLQDETPSHALVAAGLGAGEVEFCDQADMVIVAVPPSHTPKIVAEALAAYPGATVLDVASVKAPILDELMAMGIDLSRYVGTHPMAGSHRAGPLTARADLFEDRTWVVTPHIAAEVNRIDQVHALVRDCLAEVEVMDPTEHDMAVASISHVPQIVSSLMAGNLTEVPSHHVKLAGQGVRDVTRLAASDELMWSQIITANQDAIFEQLEKLASSLDEIRGNLDSEKAVESFLKAGALGARTLPGKHGHVLADYVLVTVEIPDSPGALAKLFADVEQAGVNVEDLSLSHDRTREVGFISISVLPDEAEALASTMTEAGWSLKP